MRLFLLRFQNTAYTLASALALGGEIDVGLDALDSK